MIHGVFGSDLRRANSSGARDGEAGVYCAGGRYGYAMIPKAVMMKVARHGPENQPEISITHYADVLLNS